VPTPTSSTRAHDSAELARLAHHLTAGGLVLIPTETVYGLAGSLAHPASVARLHAARAALLAPTSPPTSTTPPTPVGPVAWHAASTADALEALGPIHPAQRRAIHRLTPGPIAILVEQPADDRAATAARLGLASGPLTCQDTLGTLIRIPDFEPAQRLLSLVDAPLGAIGIPDASGRPATDAPAALARLAEVGHQPEATLDLGPTRLGRTSDRLRLHADGRWTLEIGRIFDAGYIRRQMERTILFVCTGNTCRSPMAQAIAAGLHVRASGDESLRFLSAGVAATDGSPYSRETLAAVRKLGLPAPAGQSRLLTTSMIRDAEVIYAMTARHLDAIVSLDPAAASKVRLLDPDGGDIADPVGGPQSLYDSTAAQLKALLERRRTEWTA
jgi:L-threonylcarbamoyladenylate synthase